MKLQKQASVLIYAQITLIQVASVGLQVMPFATLINFA